MRAPWGRLSLASLGVIVGIRTISSCGLMDDPERPGATVSAGLGPWGPEGAVTLEDGAGVPLTDPREPSAVRAPGGALWLYFEARGGEVWRAVSRDGARFRLDPGAPVLSPDEGDRGRLGAPSVVRWRGRWLLAAARGDDRAIVLARSDDGARFGPPSVVLSPEEGWEGGRAGAPSLAAWEGVMYLAWEGAGGIGLATLEGLDGGSPRAVRVTDGGSGTSRALDPARVSDPTRWTAVDAVGSPCLVPTVTAAGRSVLRVYFSARGAPSLALSAPGEPGFASARWSVGVAGRVRGGSFEPSPLNPVVTLGGAGPLPRHGREPSVLEERDGWVMYLRAEDRWDTNEGLRRLRD